MTSPTDLELAAFDLETTGTNVHTDRIVTAHVCQIARNEINGQNWLLNPGMKIIEAAAAVHGITTDIAERDGQDYAAGYHEIRDRLETLWANDRAICIYNAAFDLSLIHWEGKRLGCPNLEVGLVIDPYVLDKAIDPYRRGRRTLTSVCQQYGVRLDNAHTADADAVAAARLAWKLVRHPDIAALDADTLMGLQARWRAEQQASLFEHFKRQGNDAAAATVSGQWPIIRDKAAA